MAANSIPLLSPGYHQVLEASLSSCPHFPGGVAGLIKHSGEEASKPWKGLTPQITGHTQVPRPVLSTLPTRPQTDPRSPAGPKCCPRTSEWSLFIYRQAPQTKCVSWPPPACPHFPPPCLSSCQHLPPRGRPPRVWRRHLRGTLSSRGEVNRLPRAAN